MAKKPSRKSFTLGERRAQGASKPRGKKGPAQDPAQNPAHDPAKAPQPSIADRFQAAVEAHQRGDLERAWQAYNAILDDQEGHAGALHLSGVVLSQRGEHRKAIPRILGAINRRPDYADAYSHLGIALQSIGRLEEARDAYQAAVHYQPDYATAHANLANLLNRLGENRRAADHARRALSLDPTFDQAANNLGNALKALGDVHEAERIFRQLLNRKPDHRDALVNLAGALYDQGRYEEAVTLARKAEAQGSSVASLTNLGAAELANGNPTGARQAFEKIIEIAGRAPASMMNLGLVARAEGDWSAAITHLREAVSLDAAGGPSEGKLSETLVEMFNRGHRDEAEGAVAAWEAEAPDSAVARRTREIIEAAKQGLAAAPSDNDFDLVLDDLMIDLSEFEQTAPASDDGPADSGNR